jgi:hypothetical protein
MTVAVYIDKAALLLAAHCSRHRLFDPYSLGIYFVKIFVMSGIILVLLVGAQWSMPDWRACGFLSFAIRPVILSLAGLAATIPLSKWLRISETQDLIKYIRWQKSALLRYFIWRGNASLSQRIMSEPYHDKNQLL